MRKTGLPAVSEPPLEASDRVSFSSKKGLLAAKKPFYADLFSFLADSGILLSSRVRNYANLPKKSLPPSDLTIIINSLVVRINGCQNEALNSRGV